MKSGVIGLLFLGIARLALNAQNTTPIQRAPPKSQAAPNPFRGDPGAARAGAKLYLRECSACHGRAGEGIAKAPPLAAGEVRKAAPGALFWVLRNGSLRRGMPSFAHLPEPERWQIVTFLQAMQARDQP